MALDKGTLKASIKSAFQSEMPGTPTSDQVAAYDRIAAAMSDAIDIFVKSGTVTVAVGIPVATTGTAAAQTGATTATGSGVIT